MENYKAEIARTEVSVETSTMLAEKYAPFFEKIEEWREKAMSLEVSDENDIKTMGTARDLRLIFKNNRVEADKMRKELKKDALEYGRAVQGVYNVFLEQVKPIEEHLKVQEDYAKIKQQEREAELHEARIKELSEKGLTDFLEYDMDFGQMSEEDYLATKLGCIDSKKKHEDELAAEKKRQEAIIVLDSRRKKLTDYAPNIEGFWDIRFDEWSDEKFEDFRLKCAKAKKKHDEELELKRIEEDKKLAESRKQQEKELEALKLEQEAAAKAQMAKIQEEKEKREAEAIEAARLAMEEKTPLEDVFAGILRSYSGVTEHKKALIDKGIESMLIKMGDWVKTKVG